MEIVIAGISFVGLFVAWAVMPTIIKKHHADTETEVSKE
ncbi:MAG: hypothetical protein HW402_411 [Dehalococcoidales bacterium]|nr:hypothetical protein [Dehalococcoidales bacterium]